MISRIKSNPATKVLTLNLFEKCRLDLPGAKIFYIEYIIKAYYFKKGGLSWETRMQEDLF